MDAKKINAIEMTRKIRDKHAQKLAGKSHAERIAFYRERAKKMEKKIPVLRSKLTIAKSGQVEYSSAADNIKNVREKRGKYKRNK